MDSGHPTAGEIAGGMALVNESKVNHLTKRLDAAEAHIEFLVDVLNALLDRMYGPDHEKKPTSIRKVVAEHEVRIRSLGQH